MPTQFLAQLETSAGLVVGGLFQAIVAADLPPFVMSVTGTANQVVASAPTGAVTLSLPQNIDTAASPRFGNLGLGTAAVAGKGVVLGSAVNTVEGAAGSGGAGVAVSLKGGAGDPAGANAGGAVNVTGGQSGTSGTAGVVNVTGGAGGTTSGDGAQVSVTGGAGTAGNSFGGKVVVAGGVGHGNRSGGAAQMFGGNANTTGAGGSVTIAGGVGGSTSGAGGNVTIAAGGPSVNSNSNGGNLLILAGQAANNGSGNGGTAIFAGGNAGQLGGSGGGFTLTAGQAFAADGNGGNVKVTGGLPFGAGLAGSVTINGQDSAGASGTAGALALASGKPNGGTTADVTVSAMGGVVSVLDDAANKVDTFSATGLLSVRRGLTAAGANFATVGGSIFDHYADAASSHTDGTEDDLYSDSVQASTLGTNGDKLEAEYGGVFVSSATANRKIKVYFGGTAILDTGALTLSLSSAWCVYVTIIRKDASTVRYMASLSTEGAALAAYTSAGELTGLTLSNDNTLKVTGAAAGVGAAASDIVAKMGSVSWKPAA